MEACRNVEAVVIATEWKEFLEIDWTEVYDHMNKPAFVFDGRLLVDADKLTQIGFKVCFNSFLPAVLAVLTKFACVGHHHWTWCGDIGPRDGH